MCVLLHAQRHFLTAAIAHSPSHRKEKKFHSFFVVRFAYAKSFKIEEINYKLQTISENQAF